jgi:nitric oxide reductase NorE protein
VNTVADDGIDRPGNARYLPAEVGLWAFVIADTLLFGILINVHAFDRVNHAAQFRAAQAALDASFGFANTLLLLTSSCFVALSLKALRNRQRGAVAWLASAIACGCAFAVIKGAEYTREARAGFTPTTNEFFMNYYMLTGLHLLHLLVGLVVLLFMACIARNPDVTADQRAFESGAVYWHMVDLLWLLIFPVLYLVR